VQFVYNIKIYNLFLLF